MDKSKFEPIKPKKGKTLKYDNYFSTSYPDDLYEKLRRQSFRRGISLQEFARKSMEFYINHLEHEDINNKFEQRNDNAFVRKFGQ